MADRYTLAPNSGPVAAAVVTSEFELQSVTATLGAQTVQLAYSSFNGQWRAASYFDVSTSPSGTNIIHFTATDVFGTSAQKDFLLVLDRQPTLEVLAPRNGAHARPVLPIAAVANDDLESPALNISADYPWPPCSLDYTVMTNAFSTRAEGLIDLSCIDERLVTVSFTTTGPVEHRQVLALSNPRYQPLLSVDGEILDISSEALLYLSRTQELISVDRRTHQPTVLKTNFDTNALRGKRLTAAGAILLLWRQESNTTQVLDLNRGEEIYLGESRKTGPLALAANGRFAIFDTEDGTVIRDVIARTNRVISLRTSRAEIAENGAAIFIDESGSLFRYQNGELVLLEDNNFFHSFIQTDGTNFLWESTGFGPNYGTWSNKLATPDRTFILTTNAPGYFDDYKGLRGAINGGWSAFPKLGTQSQGQIWLRSPQGEILQATFLSTTSHLVGLLSDGSILTRNSAPGGDDLFLTPPRGLPKRIGTSFADYFVHGTNVTAYILGNVFSVELRGDPVGLTSPRFEGGGLLTVYVTASVPGTFDLQRSTDFTDWTNLTTVSITNTLPAKLRVSTPPGFLRLRKGVE
jgi:hypothetical protein